MADPRDVQRQATVVLSAAMLVIGVAIIVRTVAANGSPFSLGLVLGILFVLAGAGRLHLATRKPG